MSIRFINQDGTRIDSKRTDEIESLITQTGVPAFKVFNMTSLRKTEINIFGFLAVQVNIRPVPGEIKYRIKNINPDDCPVTLNFDKTGQRSGWIYDDPEGINRQKFVFKRAQGNIDLAKNDPLYPEIEKLTKKMGVKKSMIVGREVKVIETPEDIDAQIKALEEKKKSIAKSPAPESKKTARVLRTAAEDKDVGVVAHEG